MNALRPRQQSNGLELLAHLSLGAAALAGIVIAVGTSLDFSDALDRIAANLSVAPAVVADGAPPNGSPEPATNWTTLQLQSTRPDRVKITNGPAPTPSAARPTTSTTPG